jgi:hypothetical protein
MLKFTFATLLALSTFMLANTSFACPQGYTPCGEANQLCCPV